MWRLLIQNHPKPSITEKRGNEAKCLTWNSIKLKFVKKTSMSNPVESLGYIKCYSSSSLKPIQRYRDSLRYKWQKICCWLSRPKTILEIRKKTTFLLVINKSIICKFFKDFTNPRKRTNRAIVFSCIHFSNILKYFQQFRKQDSLRHILKSSANTYESSGSQFFTTTTGIQSGQDAFDESSFAMNFLIIFGVIEILCSFRFVLEGKAGKELLESSRSVFLKRFLGENFALSDGKENTSGLLNRGGTADLSLFRTLSAIC